jgi:hypothetical protein
MTLKDALNNAAGQLKQANAALACDADCQKRRKIKNLNDQMQMAQQNLNNAQPNFDRAQKNYLTAAKGAAFYTTMQERKYKTQAQNKVNDWKKQMDVSFAIIDNGLNYWESQYVYKENVGAVFNNYNNLYTDLSSKVEETRGKNNVENRLATFYNANTTIVNSVLYYLKILYWVFWVIMIVILFIKKQFKNVKIWAFIILILIFPIILEYGISFPIPGTKKEFKIPSLYEYVFQIFTHAKIDNIYFIFFTLIIGIILLFSFMSKLPFSSQPE